MHGKRCTLRERVFWAHGRALTKAQRWETEVRSQASHPMRLQGAPRAEDVTARAPWGLLGVGRREAPQGRRLGVGCSRAGKS